jgi:predicted NAD/FAD-binding protein
MGYGFHEDGLKAGLGVARQLLASMDTARTPAAQNPRAAEPELETA